PQPEICEAVGMTEDEMYAMYRLLALAKYDERYVIPPAHTEQAHSLEELATDCPVSGYDEELTRGSAPFGEGSGRPTPVAIENMAMLQNRQTSDELVGGGSKSSRVNLLNWDGKGMPEGLFPERNDDDAKTEQQ
ncbi:MAG TPA: nitrate reductase subunit beta, partial [Ruania sp.]|nr:nitrate reductase subunit beta [Ruania sp.]